MDKQLSRQNQELTILNKMAQALNRSVNLRGAVQEALAQVATLLDLQTGWVWLLDDNGRSYLAASQNLPPALSENPAQMEGNCYCLRTYREGDLEGAANVNVVECSRLSGIIAGTAGLRYHASIPLYAQEGKQLGVLNVASRDWRPLSEADLRLLHTIGDMLSIAIERASLFEQQTEMGALSERNRLAREIHDTLAQGLTAVTLHLETASALLEEAHPAHAYIEKGLMLTRTNLEEARRSVLDLRAAPLEGRTLAEALAQLVDSCEIQTSLTLVGEHRPLPTRTQIALYRITQEALNNVMQHAQANHVRINLTTTPTTLMLHIADDGVGFDVDTLDNSSRFGLRGVNERVRLLNGRFHITSSPKAGTQLEVVIGL